MGSPIHIVCVCPVPTVPYDTDESRQCVAVAYMPI